MPGRMRIVSASVFLPPMVQSGRCLCGHVRYELEGELPPLVNCHCQFCRRAHGAAFVTLGWLPRSSFRFISGEDAVHKYSAGDGFRCFCSLCGTRLFNGMENGEGFISLIVATLDEDLARGPVMHINLESKAAWYVVQDGLPQHQALPEDVVAALKAIGRT
jgi:hypothetical protein